MSKRNICLVKFYIIMQEHLQHRYFLNSWLPLDLQRSRTLYIVLVKFLRKLLALPLLLSNFTKCWNFNWIAQSLLQLIYCIVFLVRWELNLQNKFREKIKLENICFHKELLWHLALNYSKFETTTLTFEIFSYWLFYVKLIVILFLQIEHFYCCIIDFLLFLLLI